MFTVFNSITVCDYCPGNIQVNMWLSLHLCRQPSAAQLLHAARLDGGPDVQHPPLLPGRHGQRAFRPPAGHQGQSPELLYGFAGCRRAGGVPLKGPRRDLPSGLEPGLQCRHRGQTQKGPAHPQRALQRRQRAAEDQRRVRPPRGTPGGAKRR